MNKLKYLFWQFVFLGILVNVPYQTFGGDTQVENWTFVGAETKLGKLDFSIHSANFISHNDGYFLNHTQLSLDFPSKYDFYFGIAYKQEYVKFPARWRSEYRPMLHLYYEKKLGSFSLRDRSRWEFRFMDNELINRYRNQIQIAFTKCKKITPYFSTEFSFYFNDYGYSRQRTVLGTIFPIKSVNLNLFLGHQINEDLPGTWSNKILMGTGLSYHF